MRRGWTCSGCARSRASPEAPEPTRPEALYATTLAGDVVGNALYFGLVGTARPGDSVRRGLFLGLAAGAGAVALPPVLHLGAEASSRTLPTAAMAVAWYALGGLAAGAAARALR